MGVFDNFEIENEKIVGSSWVEWVHWGVPDELGVFREAARAFLAAFGHCLVCSAMDACYYASNNKPEFPHHDNCDCLNFAVSYAEVENMFNIEFSIEKFTKYIFNKNNPQNHGKFQLFTMWGFDVDDSEYLLNQISRQAKLKFLKGEYQIRSNSQYGTSIRINVVVDGRSFGTGWLILPHGKLRNLTPYASN